MTTLNATSFRKDLFKHLGDVKNGIPLIVTSKMYIVEKLISL